MDATGFEVFDEHNLFNYESREEELPSRKEIVLYERLNATGKQKLANQSRFGRKRGKKGDVPGPKRRQR